MTRATSAKAVDPRDAFLTGNTSRHNRQLPDGVVEDLRHFRKRADEGRAITWQGLAAWLLETHKLTIGRSALASLARANGIAPWWKV